MTRILSTIVVACVLTFALSESHSAQSAATIEGIVLDAASSQPLVGVRISVTPATLPLPNPFESRPSPPEVTTDSQGHFSIPTKEVGRLRVVPTREGYVDPPPGVWVQVSSGERIQNLELRMSRPAAISGKVLTADGQPIVGNAGSIALMQYTYGTDGKRTLLYPPGLDSSGAAQRMNDRGEFRFYDIPAGEYYLTVTGGSMVLGGSTVLYYPGVVDEAKATPVRVSRGEDVRLPTLVWPPREKGIEVKLRLAGALGASAPRVYIADAMFVRGFLPDPPEIPLRVVAGHYDAVVTIDSGGRDLHYAIVPLDLGTSDIELDVLLKRAPSITGQVVLENEAGMRLSAPSTLRCTLRSHYGRPPCVGWQVVPGPQELDLAGLPSDAYVLSAKAGDHDILVEGLNVTGDTNLEIVLATPGAVVQGTVRDAGGVTIPGASVALVPEPPYRSTGLLYRSVITDPNGRFEIHGIAPGSYKLFAWPELQGAAYRNADFMKEFEDSGMSVKIEKGARLSLDITAF